MDYNYNGYDRGYTEPAMTSADYMNRTYRWMAVGLLITFAAAFVTAATPLLYVVNSLYLVFTIAELVLVYVLSSRVQNMSVGGARATFFAYALLNGLFSQACASPGRNTTCRHPLQRTCWPTRWAHSPF